jgi:uncharacterized protein (TIGR03435 family)
MLTGSVESGGPGPVRAIMGMAMIGFGCLGVYGQSADAPTAFEVASVKPAQPRRGGGGMSGGPGSSDPGSVTCQNCTLSNLVMFAHNIRRYQLSAPGWLDDGRFDVVAKVPSGVTRRQTRLMLQNLLAERFKLRSHGERKEMTAYASVVGKNGPKLKESQKDPAPASPPSGSLPARTIDKDGFPMLPGVRGSWMVILDDRARTQQPEASMQDLVPNCTRKRIMT